MKLERIFKAFPDFHKWTLEKKLNATKLDILTEFQELSSIKNLILWIEKHFVSHSQGVQILDLAGELLLMDKNIKPLLDKCQDASLLIKKLKKLRFPESTLREERKKEILEKLGDSVQLQWAREKDKTGLQVQFKSYSAKDLQQKIEKLSKLCHNEELWEP